MKKLCFVQPNNAYGGSYYFPYACGCLAAYAYSDERIRASYGKPVFFYRRDPVDEVLDRMEGVDVAAFSCLVYTFEYNKALAKKVKERYPGCAVVFGGHVISDNYDVFPELPYVDYLVYGEGERAFRDVLDCIDGLRDPHSVPNIAFRDGGRIVKTPREYPDSLDDLPSPYLTGMFDGIIEEDPDALFSASVETNRGCPYGCAYCDWSFTKKIRAFPIDRVKREIDWFGRHGIDYVFCTDGNFGILERDVEIARFVCETKKKYGFPHIFNADYAKKSNDRVFDISRMFFDLGLTKGVTLSFQSVNEQALKNIGRENFSLDEFSRLIKKYNEYGIPTYTEMILGLPGETRDSFCRGLCDLIESGQQNAISVFSCQVYHNAVMGDPDYRRRFGIKTAHVPQNIWHRSVQEDDIAEYTDVVVETATMPFEDTLRCLMFTACLQCFHNIGLLKFFALYLRYEKNVSYYGFYSALFEYILNSEGTLLNSIFRRLISECREFKYGEWSYFDPRFGDIGWFMEEGVFMETVCSFDRFSREITPFLSSFGVAPDVFGELLRYQRFTLLMPGMTRASAEFDYDFYSYFNRALIGERSRLEKKRTRISVKIAEPVSDWKEYALKIMLRGKKKGRPLIVNDRENVEISYPNGEGQ
ncbi:MAG: B12-binding domain-containing radical SAM protein [Clostridia bacterium]|nr:B12-binding domain-containing radical SAM protein [Clostridia bacterium]